MVLVARASNIGPPDCRWGIKGTNMNANLTSGERIDGAEFECSNHRCPCHGSPFRKMYTFGSTMSAETEVYTFTGCGCAVSDRHDPVGTYPSVTTYHATYGEASGTGRLHGMMAAAKYR